MPTIHLHYFGGIRHKKGPWGGKSFQYGFRVPRTWFFSGEAQTSLLPAEQRPRPSNAGVIGDYLYEVRSELFDRNTTGYQVSDTLYRLSARKGDTQWKHCPRSNYLKTAKDTN